MRGDKDEADGNLKQLLRMKSKEDPNLAEWLKRKENFYISPDIQNEILKTMGLQISRKLAADIQASLFITIMVNETTDVSNSEQVTLAVIKDVLIRMNVSFSKLRGQCYDGASAMCGSKSVVAKCISDLESRAVFTHCYGHTLNLAASDTLKQCKLTKDALDMTHKITKLIKYSPRLEAIFRSLKDTLPSSSTVGVRVLCPTRWTIRADSLLSIVSNYEALQSTWDEAVTIAKDTETKAWIHGVSFQMKTFDYLYGYMLGELILHHTDNLSHTLQHKSLSAAEGQEISQRAIQTIQSIHNDESFDLFWGRVSHKATALDINEPQLPRQKSNQGGMKLDCQLVIIIENQKCTTGNPTLKQLMS